MDTTTLSSSPHYHGSGPVNTGSRFCLICLHDFAGRDVVPTVVKTQCGHRFDLECLSEHFAGQSLGSRDCVVCRQNPMPLLVESMGEFYPGGSIPDTALFRACHDGDLIALKQLIDRGADVNARDLNGFTALMFASMQDRRELVAFLIERGADINAVLCNGDNLNGCTALMLASMNGHREVIKLLIDGDADVNACMENGITALILASVNGHSEVIELLIDRGVNISAAVVSNAAMLASKNGHDKVVELLLTKLLTKLSGLLLEAQDLLLEAQDSGVVWK
ncbi:ankyrin repeat domain-containing protein [Endozoicomonas sp. SCSIO W0465]|uniref:ankyrin repeat domain-containing protein n=1 Tax=Endozoicomonas sp. SCSIO W0465 TaxID=2918516 RepID=UPI002075E939|nr:ankyrin repeat domain-containing protein [Endozoicomonas sp. SCSIO W0465]USE34550.1 ankyrin repeat domain-containing protein [Endozoicomonas sp. SCSIO W0465]